MPQSLTLPQKAILLRAYRNGGRATCVPEIRGLALERRGYGTFLRHQRVFDINDIGHAFGRDGTQVGDKT